MSSALWQALGLLGAGLDLTAYALMVRGRLRATDATFLGMNLVGTGILLAVAVQQRSLGFIVMNAAWLYFTAAATVAEVRRIRLQSGTRRPRGEGDA